MTLNQFLSTDPLRIKPVFAVEGPCTRWKNGTLYLQFAVLRRGRSVKYLFVPAAQFEHDPKSLQGIPDKEAGGFDVQFFCSANGRTVCFWIHGDRSGGGPNRAYYWREGMAGARALTGPTYGVGRLAVHVTHDGRAIWTARLDGNTVTYAKFDPRRQRDSLKGSVRLDRGMDRLPPYVFGDSAHGMKLLLGAAYYKILPSGKAVRLPEQCPYAEFGARALKFYRRVGDGRVTVTVRQSGKATATMTFSGVTRAEADWQSAIYVDDHFIEVEMGLQLRVLNRQSLKPVAVPNNSDIVLGGRALAYEPNTEIGYILLSAPLGKGISLLLENGPGTPRTGTRAYYRYSYAPGFAYQVAIGAGGGVVQIFPGSDGKPDLAPFRHAWFLAPADDRAESTP
ncbi:MAG: hypothetical protein ACYC96_05700 [Fimbriimonadaceae bacterium]